MWRQMIPQIEMDEMPSASLPFDEVGAGVVNTERENLFLLR
jgi:hypothetical protein